MNRLSIVLLDDNVVEIPTLTADQRLSFVHCALVSDLSIRTAQPNFTFAVPSREDGAQRLGGCQGR